MQYLNHLPEICPSCGRYERLVDETGWCYPCSGVTPPVVCESCGKETDGTSRLCSSCKYMRWLEQNADRIEELMASLRVSAGKAKKLVRDNNRPLCLCCNNPIRGGHSGKNFFCGKTKACRTGQNSYHYYRRQGDKNALHKAVVAAHKERLIELAISKSKDQAA